jgi:hypothetical protein
MDQSLSLRRLHVTVAVIFPSTGRGGMDGGSALTCLEIIGFNRLPKPLFI